MKLPTREDAGEIRPVRTLILGSIMCAIPSLFGPYNVVVRNGSYLTIDFTTAAAVVVMFAVCLIVNGMLRRLVPTLVPTLSFQRLMQDNDLKEFFESNSQQANAWRGMKRPRRQRQQRQHPSQVAAGGGVGVTRHALKTRRLAKLTQQFR